MPRFRLYSICILILFYSQSILMAQEAKINFDGLWKIALNQNLHIKNAELLVEKSGSMKKTAWDFGELEFDFTRGQLNSELIDNLYKFDQGLGSPFTISATKKYYESEQEFHRSIVYRTVKEVKKQLRENYYRWLYEHQINLLLDSSISQYEKSAEFAQLQYESGESNLLSKAIINSELQKLVIRKDIHEVNLKTIQNNIRTLLNSDSIFIPVEEKLSKLLIVIPDSEAVYTIDSVPEVITKRLERDLADHYYKLTKSQISPSLSAGYFNQQINQVPGFQGWQVGLSFPIWFMPQKARSQAAYIDLSRAENQYDFEKTKVTREVETLLLKYQQMQKSILHYEKDRLKNADMIDQNAFLLYKSGAIGYIEFIANLSTSREIREDYYFLINEYNYFIIELYYYLEY